MPFLIFIMKFKTQMTYMVKCLAAISSLSIWREGKQRKLILKKAGLFIMPKIPYSLSQQGHLWLCFIYSSGNLFSFIKRFYLFLDRGEGREEERKRSINMWLRLTCPLLGTWPATQACALTGNWTGDLLVCRLALNQLSHTSQGSGNLLKSIKYSSLSFCFTKYSYNKYI